jgi:hypothetical protein
MNGSPKQLTFRKTAACPASKTLLSYYAEQLSPTVAALVKHHLEICEFCNAELTLLAHHRAEQRSTSKPPEMPRNLRILAESILGELSRS